MMLVEVSADVRASEEQQISSHQCRLKKFRPVAEDMKAVF